MPPSTALGDWYVNFIQTLNHRLVHFVSDRSLLSVVIPVRTLKTALDRHLLALRELLEALHIMPAVVEAELAQMQDRAVAATRSRSVLASMRNLSLNARCILAASPGIDPLELSRELSQIPCGPLGMGIPADVAVALLLERHFGVARGFPGAQEVAQANLAGPRDAG
jgi:hypothetical protein